MGFGARMERIQLSTEAGDCWFGGGVESNARSALGVLGEAGGKMGGRPAGHSGRGRRLLAMEIPEQRPSDSKCRSISWAEFSECRLLGASL